MKTNDSMAKRVEEYLTMRRAFGYKLTITGAILHDFASFADRLAPGQPFTLELALRWTWKGHNEQHKTAVGRLAILRPFARYLRSIDPHTETIPKRIIGSAHRRYVPHIYTDQEVHDLLDATHKLRPQGGLRPQSLRTYLSLLACTGMRPPEPLKLSRNDVDLSAGAVTIRETKFSKSRIVILHPTATAALRAYASRRDRHVRRPASPNFFLIDDGRALTHKRALEAFGRMRLRLGWKRKPGQRLPRLYDFRHTFVCRRLLSWYKGNVDVDVAMPSLSTYLGHVKITGTYWYVTGIPELMEVAASRFERFVCGTDGGRR